ncbi:hypothetical protein D3C71_1788160 [compost metagenome]
MPVKFEYFKLKALTPHKKLGFVKEKINFDNLDNFFHVEFKGASEVFFAQAYKQYFEHAIQPEDLTHYYEGQLSRFLEPVKED